MAQPLERLLATGKQLGETGRSQAQQLRTDLVEQGRQATDQISAVVEQLVSPVGHRRGEDLRQTVHAEVRQAVRSLGSEIREHLASQSQGVGDQIAGVVAGWSYRPFQGGRRSREPRSTVPALAATATASWRLHSNRSWSRSTVRSRSRPARRRSIANVTGVAW